MTVFRTAILLLCLTLPMAGCGAMIVGGAAAATGAGTYAYVNNKAVGLFDATVDQAFNAALGACSEMQIPVTRQYTDDTEAEVAGKLYSDDVTISIDLVGAQQVKISVRVGLMGNESSSRRILNSISGRL